MRATRLSERVLVITGDFFDEHMTAIDTGDGLVVVDTLATMPHTRAALPLIHEFSREPVRVLVNTHLDVDHTAGNHLFDGATIISHVNGLRHRDERVFDDDESERQIRGFVAALEAASAGENAGPNPPVYLAAYRTLLSGFDDAAFRAPTLHVAGGSCVSLGDVTIELHHFGPAHTDADLIVWIPSEHLLVAGDAIMGHAYAPVAHPVHGGSVTGLVATAWEVRRLVTADTRVLPGHGEIGGLDLVQRQITYVEALLAAVREARARGMSLDEAKAALQVEAFAASLLYEFVHPGHVESAWHETLAQR